MTNDQYASGVADVAQALNNLARAASRLRDDSHPRRPLSKAYATQLEAWARLEQAKLTKHFMSLDMSTDAVGEPTARVY